MIIIRRFFLLAAACALTLIISTASANNGIEKFSDTFSVDNFYVACLGETISWEASIVAKSHGFDTPSGRSHFIYNMQGTLVITGDTTGRAWFGHGAAPYTNNVGPGATLQFGEGLVAKLISGDGPNLRARYRVKITVNANGELVIFRDDLDDVPPEEWFECLGKK